MVGILWGLWKDRPSNLPPENTYLFSETNGFFILAKAEGLKKLGDQWLIIGP